MPGNVEPSTANNAKQAAIAVDVGNETAPFRAFSTSIMTPRQHAYRPIAAEKMPNQRRHGTAAPRIGIPKPAKYVLQRTIGVSVHYENQARKRI